jgi:hypothetical protein
VLYYLTLIAIALLFFNVGVEIGSSSSLLQSCRRYYVMGRQNYWSLLRIGQHFVCRAKAARNRSGLQSRRTVDHPQDGVRSGSRLLAQLVGAKRIGKVVRLQRTNPLDAIKAELLGRLREHYAAEGA